MIVFCLDDVENNEVFHLFYLVVGAGNVLSRSVVLLAISILTPFVNKAGCQKLKWGNQKKSKITFFISEFLFPILRTSRKWLVKFFLTI